MTSRSNQSSPKLGIVVVLIVALIVLRQDNWLWTNDKLIFGCLPIGMVSQIGLSLAATAVWLLATKIAWPTDEDQAKEDLK